METTAKRYVLIGGTGCDEFSRGEIEQPRNMIGMKMRDEYSTYIAWSKFPAC
jgi:hypothetical protein